ncbi:MAG: hypothetical protein ABFD75_03115 [Smithella sp.]
MSEGTKSTILIAIISAVSAIVVAAITTYGTIVVYAPEAKKVKEELKDISDLEKIANLPIGTIVTSMLPPSLFAEVVGDPDPSVFDPRKSKWVLANGRDIRSSRYGKLSGNTETPDLRGMFLRGLNEGREDGKQDPDVRKPGDYQKDAIQQHGHNTEVIGKPTGYKEQVETPSGIGYTRHPAGRNAPHEKMSVNVLEVKGANAKVETRPRNAAVYFYIKIN